MSVLDFSTEKQRRQEIEVAHFTAQIKTVLVALKAGDYETAAEALDRAKTTNERLTKLEK